MKIVSSKAERRITWISGVKGRFFRYATRVLVVALSTAIAGPSVRCEPEKEVFWKDYRRPFEEDILVSPLSTVKVILPKEFFKRERVILSVTTDATPHSEPTVSIGTWQRDLGVFLTTPEYFTTLSLTETINLEVPTKHFRQGENQIYFHAITDSPDDEYTITRLEFVAFPGEGRTIPRPEGRGKVHIGLLVGLTGGSIFLDTQNYVDHLMDQIEQDPDCEVVVLKESIAYRDLDLDTAKRLRQRDQIDMVIGIGSHWQHGIGFQGVTKLVDLFTQRLIELDPVDIGAGYAEFRPGWDKKLISKQIGPIQDMIDEISRDKSLVTAVSLESKAPRKVRIGLLTGVLGTSLDSRFGDFKGYIGQLEHQLGERPDLEVVPIKEQINFHNLDIDVAKTLKKKHQLDILICVMTYFSSGHGYEGHTKLVDHSNRKLIELEPVKLGGLGALDIGWEKKFISKQIGTIEKMVGEIPQEETTAKALEERPERVLPTPTEVGKIRIGILTGLQKVLESEYFLHLKEVLKNKEEFQLLPISGELSYDPPYTDAIRSLRRRYGIHMIIYLDSQSWSTGTMFRTVLVEVAEERVVEPPRVFIPLESQHRWEAMLVEKQIVQIEEMMEEIYRKKRESNRRQQRKTHPPPES